MKAHGADAVVMALQTFVFGLHRFGILNLRQITRNDTFFGWPGQTFG